ncbi:hypothetical protein LTR66_011400 [Elasticomyces elasticus]|nr:hypothetical protein LTR66_011400 [Elasticomyces elasticus]
MGSALSLPPAEYLRLHRADAMCFPICTPSKCYCGGTRHGNHGTRYPSYGGSWREQQMWNPEEFLPRAEFNQWADRLTRERGSWNDLRNYTENDWKKLEALMDRFAERQAGRIRARRGGSGMRGLHGGGLGIGEDAVDEMRRQLRKTRKENQRLREEWKNDHDLLFNEDLEKRRDALYDRLVRTVAARMGSMGGTGWTGGFGEMGGPVQPPGNGAGYGAGFPPFPGGVPPGFGGGGGGGGPFGGFQGPKMQEQDGFEPRPRFGTSRMGRPKAQRFGRNAPFDPRFQGGPPRRRTRGFRDAQADMFGGDFGDGDGWGSDMGGYLGNQTIKEGAYGKKVFQKTPESRQPPPPPPPSRRPSPPPPRRSPSPILPSPLLFNPRNGGPSPPSSPPLPARRPPYPSGPPGGHPSGHVARPSTPRAVRFTDLPPGAGIEDLPFDDDPRFPPPPLPPPQRPPPTMYTETAYPYHPSDSLYPPAYRAPLPPGQYYGRQLPPEAYTERMPRRDLYQQRPGPPAPPQSAPRPAGSYVGESRPFARGPTSPPKLCPAKKP